MRILCLHGLANNNELMKSWLQPYEESLSDYNIEFIYYQVEYYSSELDLEFIPSKFKEKHKGNLYSPSPRLQGKHIYYPHHIEVLESLINFVNETGPYEGMLAFS